MHALPTPPGLQPLLHESVVALRAPAQVWSAADGTIGEGAIDGVYVSDLRVLDELRLTVAGASGEHLATEVVGASELRFVTLHRGLDAPGADPDVRGTLTRTVTADGVAHRFDLTSRLDRPISAEITVELRTCLVSMEVVKGGLAASSPTVAATVDGERLHWAGGSVRVDAVAPGAQVRSQPGGRIHLVWNLDVPARSTATIGFDLAARDAAAVVAGASGPAPWSAPDLRGSDDRLARWIVRALDDLDALRLVSDRSPGDQFFAAGAPWFFTLFGRDAIWAARMLLPLGHDMAGGTLRVLAALQGGASVVDTAEQPGKIMHELRRAAATHTEGFTLPPLYYGTVDATPLWICLLADARDAGLPDDEVRMLIPHLEAALAWMRDFGDSDGDGLLEYVDATGTGLSNQGWKDSGDAVQWRDGRLAEGPIALCEVQAYAFEAAMRGADMLDAFGPMGSGAPWREWAARLATRFRETFWISDAAGAYPAIALDAAKRPVDTVTSNLGHLLGTGLLDADESALVAARLVSPELDSGFGLRTMSTDSAGYWPLSYHGGSVWTHDTAIAISGLSRAGFSAEAANLSEGLMRAAVAFDYRMPELHGGDAATAVSAPIPYPAACRPQAWSAAAAVAVWSVAR
ncbi:glycogen debranching N-terminal domain-containing protein [soil metagenome]